MKLKFLILAMTLFLMPGGACFAEWFDGEVEKIDSKAGTLTISEIDPITNTAEAEEIVIEPATVFLGIQSLKDLRKGDDISVEAKYDEPTDAWKAVSVEMAQGGD